MTAHLYHVTISENARVLAAEARRLGLTTYLMSKQYGRNPYVSSLALAHGLHKIVAVDVTCSLMARRYGLPVGHMGHLNQIPLHMLPAMLAMRPEVITFDHAATALDEALNPVDPARVRLDIATLVASSV